MNFVIGDLKSHKLNHQLHQGVPMCNQCDIPRSYSSSIHILLILKRSYRKAHRFRPEQNAVSTSDKTPPASSQSLENKVQTSCYAPQIPYWPVLPNSDVMPNFLSSQVLFSFFLYKPSFLASGPKHILFPPPQLLSNF